MRHRFGGEIGCWHEKEVIGERIVFGMWRKIKVQEQEFKYVSIW